MCVDYDTRVAKHCREPTAEEVSDKTHANFCDHFKPRPAAYVPANTAEIDKAKIGTREAVRQALSRSARLAAGRASAWRIGRRVHVKLAAESCAGCARLLRCAAAGELHHHAIRATARALASWHLLALAAWLARPGGPPRPARPARTCLGGGRHARGAGQPG